MGKIHCFHNYILFIFTLQRNVSTSSPQCSGGSCPLDLSRLSSSPGKNGLAATVPYSITKRHYSKRAIPEREQNRKNDSDSDSESDSDTERKGLERVCQLQQYICDIF